jgi:NAD(P)-dependent dehydrogenase (short-subunit alcohol dehydrogenase family)
MQVAAKVRDTVSPPMTLLREQLLAGRAVALDGAGLGGVGSLLDQLGARVEVVGAPPLDALVVSCAAAFGDGGAGGLQAALERTWTVVQAVATEAMIEAGGGGKIVLIAPPAGAGELAVAASAALENLARTLSVEWARHRITTCAIVPGANDDELAELVAFLVSPAGDYFSGCRFDLSA